VGVDLSVDLDADCAPEVLFAHVADLGAYPAWLGIVDNAVPHPGLDLTLGVDGDGDADLAVSRTRQAAVVLEKCLPAPLESMALSSARGTLFCTGSDWCCATTGGRNDSESFPAWRWKLWVLTKCQRLLRRAR
jgi:hypothetical protein